jgi:hypothetical protein
MDRGRLQLGHRSGRVRTEGVQDLDLCNGGVIAAIAAGRYQLTMGG